MGHSDFPKFGHFNDELTSWGLKFIHHILSDYMNSLLLKKIRDSNKYKENFKLHTLGIKEHKSKKTRRRAKKSCVKRVDA